MTDPVVDLPPRPSDSSLSSEYASTRCSGFQATESTGPLHGGTAQHRDTGQRALTPTCAAHKELTRRMSESRQAVREAVPGPHTVCAVSGLGGM